MSSGQWDLQALEAIEREASEIFDVLDVPERLRSPAKQKQKQCAAKKLSPASSFDEYHPPHPQQHQHQNHGHHAEHQEGCEENVDFELQDHIKHCSCSCNHMGYGNYMDYQVLLRVGFARLVAH